MPVSSSKRDSNSRARRESRTLMAVPYCARKPPVALPVLPSPGRSMRSSTTTSRTPRVVRWYATLAPMTPLPITTTAARLGRLIAGLGLLREDVLGVLEGLELERVSAGVAEEHRHLLARLALETDAGLDDERHSGASDPVRGLVKLVPAENRAEVGHGDRQTFHLPGVMRLGDRPRHVAGDLVSEEVEVDPVRRAPPFLATQKLSVEPTRRIEIADVEREVERLRHGIHPPVEIRRVG